MTNPTISPGRPGAQVPARPHSHTRTVSFCWIEQPGRRWLLEASRAILVGGQSWLVTISGLHAPDAAIGGTMTCAYTEPVHSGEGIRIIESMSQCESR
ncbi:hypothetical protein N7537_003738 [Penicillium hordei]|uniref:Uncharacterized protein n=1 Tax=Penicillium hordei TaxID=40994 RepID=A0AAD6EA89_9EURO|nr:uncharacterized protein N7537_003738 [Penicillium hordei]KAJ5607119.1 hypothetical protein N7537_003738 [Penicillium hordei]